ncbi:hypothetical protein U2340_15335, partial [Listeria monocytogenes]
SLNLDLFVREIGLHIQTRLSDMMDFDQKNPHHNKDLYDHTISVYKYLKKNTVDWRVLLASLYHDVGKLDT